MSNKTKYGALVVSLIGAVVFIGGVTLIGSNTYTGLDRSPQKNILLSVVPGISLTKYDSEKHGALAPSRDSSFVRTAPYLFVLKNETNRQLTGLTLRWSWSTAGSTKVREGTLMVDSYFLSNSKIEPGKELLIGPQSIASLTMAKSGKVAISINGTGALDQFDASTSLGLTVDAVLFENGEVLGPNLTRMDEKIQKRNKALSKIVEKLRRGISIEDLATEQSGRASAAGDVEPQIIRILQSSKSNAEALVFQLGKIQAPPTFQKGDIQ